MILSSVLLNERCPITWIGLHTKFRRIQCGGRAEFYDLPETCL